MEKYFIKGNIRGIDYSMFIRAESVEMALEAFKSKCPNAKEIKVWVEQEEHLVRV